jgi:hypothetical protein
MNEVRVAFLILGSARASRAGFGASPKDASLRQNKFAMAEAPSPAREARALPKLNFHA